jgi:hypothetical protein
MSADAGSAALQDRGAGVHLRLLMGVIWFVGGG